MTFHLVICIITIQRIIHIWSFLNPLPLYHVNTIVPYLCVLHSPKNAKGFSLQSFMAWGFCAFSGEMAAAVTTYVKTVFSGGFCRLICLFVCLFVLFSPYCCMRLRRFYNVPMLQSFGCMPQLVKKTFFSKINKRVNKVCFCPETNYYAVIYIFLTGNNEIILFFAR